MWRRSEIIRGYCVEHQLTQFSLWLTTCDSAFSQNFFKTNCSTFKEKNIHCIIQFVLFKRFWCKKMSFSRWLPTSGSAFSQKCSTFEILKTPFYSKVFLKQDNVIPIWLPISNSAFLQNLKSKVFETNCSIFETLKLDQFGCPQWFRVFPTDQHLKFRFFEYDVWI